MSAVIDPVPVPAPAPVAEPTRRAPRYPAWLAPVVVAICLAATVACCVAAIGAAHRASVVESWSYTVGVIVAHPYDDRRGPGVVYYDERGRQRVMWLAPGDVADMPPGAIGTIAFRPDTNDAEFRFLPRQREHAYQSLGALSAACMAAAGGWWWADRRARARARAARHSPGDADLRLAAD